MIARGTARLEKSRTVRRRFNSAWNSRARSAISSSGYSWKLESGTKANSFIWYSVRLQPRPGEKSGSRPKSGGGERPEG